MKITVTTPCYQEIRFVRAWMENVLGWADAVVVSDGGSVDGTREVLADYERKHPGQVRVLDRTQHSEPNCYGYREGERRQELTEQVLDGLIVNVDMDEMLPDNFREIVENCLPAGTAGQMDWLNFWRSPNYIRVGTVGDPAWGPVAKACVFPAGMLSWDKHPHHAKLLYSGPPPITLPGAKFHYHYLFAQPKTFENRLPEMRGQNLSIGVAEIRLATIQCEHPRAMRMLRECVTFAELLPK